MATIEHINPKGIISNPAFTNVITVKGAGKTIYIGEQNSNNEKGEVVAKGDFKAQTEQVLKNIGIALQAAGAGFDDVIKWSIYAVEGQPLQEGFAAWQKVWGNRPNPPIVTMCFVAALANPDYLVGIEAIAVVE
jgi:enamine deaminase RidA (YjgF/YER057c/UK114 family)